MSAKRFTECLVRIPSIDAVENHLSAGDEVLVHVATPTRHYGEVVEALKMSSILNRCWLLFEKPIGHDETTANGFIHSLREAFQEVPGDPDRRLFFVDHYLHKQVLDDLLKFRTHNQLVFAAWNGRAIDRVDILMKEDELVPMDRWETYDQMGVIRDVIQSHGIMLLVLTALSIPLKPTSEAIRAARASFLSGSAIIPSINNLVCGQYVGYSSDPESRTVTYASVEFQVTDVDRWNETKFTITAGKALDERRTSVVVTFRSPSVRWPVENAQRGVVTIDLQPNAGISFDLMGLQAAERLTGEHHDSAGNEYVSVIRDALEGDHTHFQTATEIIESWKLVEPFLATANSDLFPLARYEPGTPPNRIFPPRLGDTGKERRTYW